MSLIRWDPGKDMVSLRDAMNKLFEESIIKPSSFTVEIGSGNLAVDMYQTTNEVVIKAPIPGVKPEDVDVSIVGDTVTIKAEQKEEKETKDKDFIRKEVHYGALSRSITLPAEVNPDKANATFENGILILSIPKVETAKPKQIKVQVKGKTSETN